MCEKKEVDCGNVFCDKKLMRPIADVMLKQKGGKHHFCGLTCAGYYKNTKDAQDHLKSKDAFMITKQNLSFILKIMGAIRRKSKPNAVNYRKNAHIKVSIADIIDVWEYQKGICVYSLVKLQTASKASQMYKATLDRKDSSMPYINGNIQFLSQSMNCMKNTMGDTDALELLDIIVENRTNREVVLA